MKNKNISNRKVQMLLVVLSFFINTTLYSQAPSLDWNYTSEYDNPYLGGTPGTSSLDWIYNIIGTSDGGSLGVGFAVAQYGANPAAGYPAAVKVDANGNTEWMYVYHHNNIYNGLFYDVVELDGDYYMIGIKIEPGYTSTPGLVLVKINSTGTAQYYKYIHPGNLPDFATWNTNHNGSPYPTIGVGNYTSINSYYDSYCGCEYLIIASSVYMDGAGGPGIDKHQGAILINVDLSGAYNSSFGPGGGQYGYQIYQHGTSGVDGRTTGYYANKIVSTTTGDVTGFILTGSTLITPQPISTSGLHCGTPCNLRYAYVVKTDMVGDMVWESVFDENSISYTDPSSTAVCTSCDNEFGSQTGRQVEQKPGTDDFIVLGEFDYNLCFGTCPTNTLITGAVTTFDGVVFGVDANGAYSSSVFQTSLAENYGASVFVSRMVVLCDGSVVVCGDIVNSAANEFEAELVKLPPGGGTFLWKGAYAGSTPKKCTYGMDRTLDGGFVIAGNNLLNLDDFDIIKAAGPYISGPQNICSGSSAQLSAIGSGLNSGVSEIWHWYTGSCGGTSIGTGSSITVSPTSTTTYYAVSFGTGGCYTSPCLSFTVNVQNSVPSAPTTIQGAGYMCLNTPHTFSTTSNNAVSYTWSVNNATATYTCNTSSCTMSFSQIGGGATVCVTASNACGTSSQRCNGIGNGITVLCCGINGQENCLCGLNNVTYTVQAGTHNPTSYTWSVVSVNPAGSVTLGGSPTNSETVSFSNSFVSCQLQVYATNICGNSVTRTLNLVGPPAKPGVISGVTPVCPGDINTYSTSGSSCNGATYNWTVPSGCSILSGQTTTSVSVQWGNNAGSVIVSASNNCGTSSGRSFAVALAGNCRIAPGGTEYSPGNFEIAPNPSNGNFTISVQSSHTGNLAVHISDFTGRLIIHRSEKIAEGNNHFVFDLGNVAKGIYYLDALTEGEKFRNKIVVQ